MKKTYEKKVMWVEMRMLRWSTRETRRDCIQNIKGMTALIEDEANERSAHKNHLSVPLLYLMLYYIAFIFIFIFELQNCRISFAVVFFGIDSQ